MQSAGNIEIGGGTIYATGGLGSAGIGAGSNGTAGDITISGGTIFAESTTYAAGIGSGSTGSSTTISEVGNITITGGYITAIGTNGSAGIGSGGSSSYYSTAGNITITGGTIIATGSSMNSASGAGIGSGRNGVTGDITYVEECVTATGGINAEDIGAGTNGTVGTITTIPLTSNDDNTDTDPDVEYETTYTTTTVTRTETEVYNGDGLILHVADQNNPYNKIEVYIDPMTGEALKIKPLYVYDQELAGAAINIVKDAINYVSKNRGDLGALQNRLERTINNNNNTSENMTSARSTIKDTDMAKEMMEYTKMNVLTEASQAMLAQSNQAIQQILSLLG